MIVTDLADLVGARGPRVRWERALLFALAMLVASTVQTLLLPLAVGGGRVALSSFFSLAVLTGLAAGVLRSLFLTVLVVLLLRRVRDLASALLVLAAVYAVFSRAMFLLTLAAQSRNLSDDPRLALFDPLSLALSAAWPLLFFGGLVLALRTVPGLLAALLAGALGAQLVLSLLYVARLVATQHGADVASAARFLPLSLAHAAVFALLLGLGLRLFSSSPTDAPAVAGA